MILIIGSISFLEKGEDDIEEYTDKERFAIVHSIETIVACADEEEAGNMGEEALTMGYDSYLIPDEYLDTGDIEYECSADMLPISVEDFEKDYLN
jgi:hypothetical protein